MIEALRPVYEAALKTAEWTLEQFEEFDESIHAAKAKVLAVIDKLREELGLPAIVRGAAAADFSAEASAFVASLSGE
jgi:hypothetical protein